MSVLPKTKGPKAMSMSRARRNVTRFYRPVKTVTAGNLMEFCRLCFDGFLRRPTPPRAVESCRLTSFKLRAEGEQDALPPVTRDRPAFACIVIGPRTGLDYRRGPGFV